MITFKSCMIPFWNDGKQVYSTTGKCVKPVHAKYEVSISYGSKVIANIKSDNLQTDRQEKNEMPRSFDQGA